MSYCHSYYANCNLELAAYVIISKLIIPVVRPRRQRRTTSRRLTPLLASHHASVRATPAAMLALPFGRQHAPTVGETAPTSRDRGLSPALVGPPARRHARSTQKMLLKRHCGSGAHTHGATMRAIGSQVRRAEIFYAAMPFEKNKNPKCQAAAGGKGGRPRRGAHAAAAACRC